MGIRKLGLLVAAIMVLSVVGAVSAQSSTPQPNQQWQGQNWCRDNNNQNNNNNNNCDPNWWQNHNGQGGNNGNNGNNNNNNNNDPNWWMNNHHDPRDHRFNNGFPFFNNMSPGQPIVSPAVTTTTITVQSISQDAVLRHIIQIVADSLNLQSSDVMAQMTGSTLAAVITAHGGNAATIQTQIITGLTTWLNEIVSDGLITQASANTVLDDITNIVSRALNGQFTQSGTVVTGLVM